MNVIILHCHFERGGVTQVVENQIRSLRDAADVDRIVLVSGQRTAGLSEATRSTVQLVQIPDFDYDDVEKPTRSAHDRGQQIARRLQDALGEAGIDADKSVLHWHNHSLGKNTAAPAAIAKLAAAGWRLLLQIHDFAEDNRPSNYLPLINGVGAKSTRELDAYLYPSAPQIHYAGLTRADASVIAALGIPEDQTHCLPNSVAPPTAEKLDRESALEKLRPVIGLPPRARWTLYPVRGIRRKNIGEFLLLSRWLKDNTLAGLTLCPATPVEKRSYDRWRRFAREVAPHAIFDAAHYEGISFAESLAASEFIISTSVAEGFGMAFLEPWLARRRVIARRLPTVTDDFESAGVKMPDLYDQIPIPGDQTWLQACRRETEQAFTEAWSLVPEGFRPHFDIDWQHDADHIDFARLTPDRQMEILRRAAGDAGFERSIQQSSTRLVKSLQADADSHEDLIQHNANVVAREYSVEHPGSTLTMIYDRLLNTPPADQFNSTQCDQSAVDLVSHARPFFPCRTEIPDE